MHEPLTACKQYCRAAGATQVNIAYTQNVMGKAKKTAKFDKQSRE